MQRDLILIALSMFTWGLGESGYFYLQPVYIQHLGADPRQIGLIYSALGMAMAVAHIPAGYLADRIGQRPLLWAAWVMGLVAAAMMAWATALPFFVVGMLTYGITAFVMAPLSSYVTAASGSWSVQRALTTISASYSAGAILGPWLGGQIARGWGIRTVYWMATGVFLVSTVIILFIRTQPKHLHTHTNQRAPWQFEKRYRGYLVVVLLVMFAIYLPQPLSSNYLAQVHGLSLDQIGLLGSCASLGVTLLGLTLGRMKLRVAFLLAQAIMAGFTLLLWGGQGLAWFGLGYFMLGGYRVARSMAIAQTRNLVQPNQVGLAYGITEATNGLAMIVAPSAAGLLYAQQPWLMYPISLGLICVALLVSAWATQDMGR